MGVGDLLAVDYDADTVGAQNFYLLFSNFFGYVPEVVVEVVVKIPNEFNLFFWYHQRMPELDRMNI